MTCAYKWNCPRRYRPLTGKCNISLQDCRIDSKFSFTFDAALVKKSQYGTVVRTHNAIYYLHNVQSARQSICYFLMKSYLNLLVYVCNFSKRIQISRRLFYEYLLHQINILSSKRSFTICQIKVPRFVEKFVIIWLTRYDSL